MDVPTLSPRDPNSHKGCFGRALIVGGSRGMAGAVALAGMAATRSGAGLTILAVPDCCLETVAAFDPNYMTVAFPNDAIGRFHRDCRQQLDETAAKATSIGLGPGLSTSDDLTRLVSHLYLQYEGPMVVDADGLNALAHASTDYKKAAGPRVLTPHVGEFRRLVADNKVQAFGLSSEECRDMASAFAAEYGVVLVMKGHHTIVTDGTETFENTTGNPGMATGGSGDVLTGVITALLGQDFSPMEGAILGVHVHGLAGDLARDAKGEISMTV